MYLRMYQHKLIFVFCNYIVGVEKIIHPPNATYPTT